MPSQTQAREQYRQQKVAAAGAVLAVRQTLTTAPKTDTAVAELAASVTRYQVLATTRAASLTASEQGLTSSSVVAGSLAGATAMGFPLADSLTVLYERYLALLKQGLATNLASFGLTRFIASEVADAARVATQLQVTAGGSAGYIRVLNLPSCPRCAILAGRVYRYSEGFDRHPLCDCAMYPVDSEEAARAHGLLTNPAAAVRSGQVTGLSQADTQAILDGADPSQVINARRGLAAPGVTAAVDIDVFGRHVKATTDGTTKRAAWRQANPNLPVRLRPASIYEHAKDREDAIRLLKLYGYITNDASTGVSKNNRTSVTTSTGGVQSGRSPSAAGLGGAGGSGGRGGSISAASGNDPDDTDLAAWKIRQDALPVNFGGDTLQPWEVRTVERMLALGHSIAWIPQDRRTATHDFVWTDQPDQPKVEMKTTRPTAGSIHGRIVDAASRAWINHKVVKASFLIDIEGHELPSDVREALEQYNVGRRKYHLKHLWVMSRGQLEEINLR